MTTTRAEATRMARLLMDHWGLADWTFGFNRRKTQMGLCRYTPKRIELSLYFVQANPPERVRLTILHEIAHALAGPKAGHGPVWKAWARKVGAPPQRCGVAEMPKGAWAAVCGRCGTTHRRHRRPLRASRCACHFDSGILVWRKGVTRASS